MDTGALIEDTFQKVLELDSTTCPRTSSRLQKLIDRRSEQLGTLAGVAVCTLDGVELAVCLDFDQAAEVQLALMLHPTNSCVTVLSDTYASIVDFVHPALSKERVAALIVESLTE